MADPVGNMHAAIIVDHVIEERDRLRAENERLRQLLHNLLTSHRQRWPIDWRAVEEALERAP